MTPPSRMMAGIFPLTAILCFVITTALFPFHIDAQTNRREIKVKEPVVTHLAERSKRWALVIGINDYEDQQIPTLTGAVNDANAISKALIDYAGFPKDQVILLASDQPLERRPTRGNILQRLSNLKYSVPKDGLLLVSFAGHGIDKSGRAFLLPSDARNNDDIRLLENTSISVEDVREMIGEAGTKQVIVILDSCRNEPGGRSDSINPLTKAYTSGFDFAARNQEIDAFVMLYATQVGDRAYEYTEKKHGYFTWFLVEGLSGKAANQQGEVTLGSLIKYLEDQVPKQIAIDLGYGKRQKPWADSKGFKNQELVLSIVPRPSIAMDSNEKPKTSPSRSEELFWGNISDSNDPEDYREYLKVYPNGIYAVVANRNLRGLEAAAKAKEDERNYWQKIENSTNAQDFQNYITKYGAKGIFHADAQVKARKLEALAVENAVWKRIEASQNPRDFRDYINTYKSQGLYYERAEAKLKELEDIESERVAWQAIENSTNLQDFQNHINKYGQTGLHYSAAQTKIRRLESLALEREHWGKIVNSSEPQVFREYVSRYGKEAIYYSQALETITRLESNLKKADSNSSLQPIGAAVPASAKTDKKELATGSDNTFASRTGGLNANWSSFSFNTIILDDHGKPIGRSQAQALSFVEDIGDGVKLEMVEIPQGTFTMGSPQFEAKRVDNEGPLHLVTLKSFVMSRYEITQAQWRAVASMKKVSIDLHPDPSKFKGDNLPVDNISWEEAVEFCERLSRNTGRKYRLPSESEWEYACRAGTTTPFSFGGTITIALANYDGTFPYKSAPKGINRQRTSAVGFLGTPNMFGLYDMHGNVSEWCADSWFEDYNNAPGDGSARMSISKTAYQVVRGGNWYDQARDVRSAARNYFPRDHRSHSLGFRIVFAP